MSQFNFGTIVASTKSGSGLAADLNAWRDALHTTHKGAAVPTYKVAGLNWINDTNAASWVDYVYDGVGSALRGFIDPVGHRYSSAGNFARTIASGGATLHLSDWGTLFNFSGASAQTVAIDPKATLIAGWWVRIIAANITITIDPYAAETVDGVTALTLTAGASITLFYDGTNLFTDNTMGGAFPVGGVVHVPSANPPAGFLRLNGALLTRASYTSLWGFAQASGNLTSTDALWTEGQFSPGDGSTTFRIPDGRGNFVRNWDNARGVDASRAIGTLQQDAIESHAHTASSGAAGTHNHAAYGTIDAAAAHSHTYTQIYTHANYWENSIEGGDARDSRSANTGTGGAHGHTFSGGYTDTVANHAHTVTVNATPAMAETRPRNIALLACIKY
jgi:microcystin-dependent protein